MDNVNDYNVSTHFEVEEKQKKELAENLHDHLGQALAMIRLTLKKIQGNAVFCGLDGEINYALSLTEKCIKYSRDMVTELSPLTLHKFGLIPALESLIENFQARYQLKIKINHNTLPPLNKNQLIYLYRSINELLLNIIKHAKAKKVSIDFISSNSKLKVIIQDDGIGINSNQKFGFGLMSVQERINCLKGNFSLGIPQKGTLINIEIPIEKSEYKS